MTQKSSVPRKHGMQSLGKVPTARRPPANLPSIRAEATTTSSNTTIVNNSTSTSAATTDPQQQQQQVQQQQAGTTGPVSNAAGQGSWASDSKNVSTILLHTLNAYSNKLHYMVYYFFKACRSTACGVTAVAAASKWRHFATASAAAAALERRRKHVERRRCRQVIQ